MQLVALLMQIVIVEFAVDFALWKAAVQCLWQVTDVLELKIHLAEVQSCFVRLR